MTALASHCRLSRAQLLARLDAIAGTLAPLCYAAECDLLGLANTATPFASLPADHKAIYVARARVTVLGGLGWVHGKARERAITLAVNDAADENGAAFHPLAERLLERVSADAMGRAEGLLQDAWLELEGVK